MEVIETLNSFLSHLHRGGEWAYWWTAEDKRTSWWPTGRPARVPKGPVNVFFGVHPTHERRGDTKRARIVDIAAVNCLFAELDAKDFSGSKPRVLAHLDTLEAAPSVIVDSGGGYHAYWLLADPFTLVSEEDRQRARTLQKQWVGLVGGDDGAKDLARILRVPGTTNYKPAYAPDFPLVCFIRADLDQEYPLQELAALVPEPKPNPPRKTYTSSFADNVSKAAKWLDRLSLERADKYSSWVEVGMALSELGDAGLALWREWSQQSGKYQPGDCDEKWPSFKPGAGITLGSLKAWADEDDPAGAMWQPSSPPPNTNSEPPQAGDPGPVEAEPTRPNTWPYAVHGGRLVYQVAKANNDGESKIDQVPIADFTAHIAEEITSEEGDRFYRLAGAATRGGSFETEITAEDFSEDRKLKAALDAAAGAQDPVRAGMTKHLGPAVKLLTGDDLIRTRRYNRTGWAEGRFLLPGREPPGVQIALPRKLPYSLNPNADLALGLEALESLILAMGPQRSSPIVAFAFQGAFASLAGWRTERYCMAIEGRTGTLKTSCAQVLLCLWGPDFMDDSLLIKWGEGATRNAIMAMATHAHDLPLLIDNFKPSTGGGTRDFVNLIHNILEGGEKDRLNRAAQLRETRPVFCWPLVTGEDMPDRDPATLARILVVPFTWEQGKPNEHLAKAQRLAPHLSSVGAAWLDWLETDTGAEVAQQYGRELNRTRNAWANKLQKAHPHMGNSLRVATNLASNLLTWAAMGEHPTVGGLAQEYAAEHHSGIELIAYGMGEHTTQALEAIRYLEALRQLLTSGRVILLDSTAQPQPVDPTAIDRFVGWEDGGGGAYLIPDVAREKVERLIGKDGLGYLSNMALYAQLKELGAIASKTGAQSTKVIRVGDKNERVLHIGAGALAEAEPEGGAK